MYYFLRNFMKNYHSTPYIIHYDYQMIPKQVTYTQPFINPTYYKTYISKKLQEDNEIIYNVRNEGIEKRVINTTSWDFTKEIKAPAHAKYKDYTRTLSFSVIFVLYNTGEIEVQEDPELNATDFDNQYVHLKISINDCNINDKSKASYRINFHYSYTFEGYSDFWETSIKGKDSGESYVLIYTGHDVFDLNYPVYSAFNALLFAKCKGVSKNLTLYQE
ncbi:hypothetical protein KHQ81_00820 [Mycoplasmatota bacterium]|nr:hypothetical protein KHQ81_00820 [Mycoplasmatota bacterium]